MVENGQPFYWTGGGFLPDAKDAYYGVQNPINGDGGHNTLPMPEFMQAFDRMILQEYDRIMRGTIKRLQEVQPIYGIMSLMNGGDPEATLPVYETAEQVEKDYWNEITEGFKPLGFHSLEIQETEIEPAVWSVTNYGGAAC